MTDSSVPADNPKDGEERQKARKKAKKLRARMNSRWCISAFSLSLSLYLYLSLPPSVWLSAGVAARESFMSDKEMESRGYVHPGCRHGNTDELNLWPLSVIGEEKVRIDPLAPPLAHPPTFTC